MKALCFIYMILFVFINVSFANDTIIPLDATPNTLSCSVFHPTDNSFWSMLNSKSIPLAAHTDGQGLPGFHRITEGYIRDMNKNNYEKNAKYKVNVEPSKAEPINLTLEDYAGIEGVFAISLKNVKKIQQISSVNVYFAQESIAVSNGGTC